MEKLFGAIEAGGTKFVCMVASGPERVVEETRFPTTTPDETIDRAVEFFRPYTGRGQLAAVGIGSFGPVDLDPVSPTYGFITTTPKPGWSQVDLRGHVARGLELPVAFDVDVVAAAIGEHAWVEANRELDPFVYVTVGTGIGVGVIANGRPLHGLIHPEAGHFPIPHDRQRDPFRGVCPYHDDCWEGLATGPSMEKRWGQKAESLPADHPGWDLEAEYLALGIQDLVYAYSPQRIVLGGGVAQAPGLLDKVRARVRDGLNGYVHSPLVVERIEEYLVPPALGSRSGGLGAIAMARDLLASA